MPLPEGGLLGPHSMFVVTTEGTNKLVFYNTRPQRLARDEHSRLLGPFVNYEKMNRSEYALHTDN